MSCGDWCLIGQGLAVAAAGTLAWYAAQRLSGLGRTLAWLVASSLVAFSPALVPLSAKPFRLGAARLAITLLVKLYDLHGKRQPFACLNLRSYVTYLGNPFWLVRRRIPDLLSRTQDVRRLAWGIPVTAVSLFPVVGLWRCDWSRIPFLLEHTAKVSAVVMMGMLMGNIADAGIRLLGERALDMMNHPLAARTPAEFWRRWNLPAQQFLQEHVFVPTGGLRRPLRATLVTFVVSGVVHEYVFDIASGRIQGDQLLFFAIQGCAAAISLRWQPTRWMSPFGILGTTVFNLLTAILFFRSVDAVVPFYWPRGS